MTDENNIEVAEDVAIVLTNGATFMADTYAVLGGVVMARGDWQRQVELIGLSPTTLSIPLTSIQYIRHFDQPEPVAEAEPEENER